MMSISTTAFTTTSTTEFTATTTTSLSSSTTNSNENIAAVDYFEYDNDTTEIPEDITHVKICGDVKVVPSHVFTGNRQLQTLLLEEGVEEIATSAFEECKVLHTVQYPTSLRIIHAAAFQDCANLLVFQLAAKNIQIKMKKGTASMMKITRGSQLSSIGDSCFCFCSSLREIELPYLLTDIGPHAFRSCDSLERVLFRSNLHNFSNSSIFQGCKKLQSILLPPTTTSFSSYGMFTFMSCRSLTIFQLPKQQQQHEFGSYVFSGCNALRDAVDGEDDDPKIEELVQHRFDGTQCEVHKLMYYRYHSFQDDVDTSSVIEQLDMIQKKNRKSDHNVFDDKDIFGLTALDIVLATSFSSSSENNDTDTTIIQWLRDHMTTAASSDKEDRVPVNITIHDDDDNVSEKSEETTTLDSIYRGDYDASAEEDGESSSIDNVVRMERSDRRKQMKKEAMSMKMMVSNGTNTLLTDINNNNNNNTTAVNDDVKKKKNIIKIVTGKCKVFVNPTTCLEYEMKVIYIGETIAKQYLQTKKKKEQSILQ